MLNKIHLGDCLEVMKDIPSGTVDMILADLPYGTTACLWDEIIPFEPMWKEYERVIKDNGAIVLTASQPFTSALVMSNPKMFKYSVIWEKPQVSNPFMAKKQIMKVHEDICIFYKKQSTYNPQMTIRLEKNKRNNNSEKEYKQNGVFGKRIQYSGDSSKELKLPISVLKFNREMGMHPTQKPVKLFEYLIKTYSNENETVLDNTIGSGTTAIACMNTNRNFIGIEMNEGYYNMANKRIKEHKQQTSLF